MDAADALYRATLVGNELDAVAASMGKWSESVTQKWTNELLDKYARHLERRTLRIGELNDEVIGSVPRRDDIAQVDEIRTWPARDPLVTQEKVDELVALALSRVHAETPGALVPAAAAGAPAGSRNGSNTTAVAVKLPKFEGTSASRKTSWTDNVVRRPLLRDGTFGADC